MTKTRLAEGIVSSKALDLAAEDLRAQSVEHVRTLVVQGLPGRAVADTARTEDVQLIVVTTRARGGVARAFAGSVSDQVSRSTPGIPVLIVHRDENAE